MFNIIITGKLESKEFTSQMLEKLFFLKKKNSLIKLLYLLGKMILKK